MRIEIELDHPDSKDEIYDLRNYLLENLDGISLHIKESPPQEGQMALGLLTDPVIGGVVEALVGFTIHQVYDGMLKPKINAWLQAKKAKGASNLGVLSTLKDDQSKVHFLQSGTGETKVYDHVRYAIDTERTYALLIGSGEFEHSFAPIPPVQQNLEDFYGLLTSKLHVGLPKENVTITYNKSNTEIEEALLQTSRKPDMETLIIYFTGHGHRTDVKKLYLIAHNTKKIDDYILGGIDFDFISNAVLKNSTARQKILILDACHSGIATQSSESMITNVDVKGTYTLTSSPGDEVSYFDKNGRNTYFTGALIEALTNGVDNTNELLALDDLYEHAQAHLQRKNFPHPVFKSQLNIPPSHFFISRNPAFSADKLKRRPAQLYSQGKLQDALYEYELVLQKYPDDLNLRREADHCRSQILFSQLVHDADELYYQHHNYADALEKYRKAIQVKQDDMVQQKIGKCVEILRTRVPSDPPNPVTPPIPKVEIEKKEKEKQKDSRPHPQIQTPNQTAVILSLIWLVISAVSFFIDFYEWYLPIGPIFLVTVVLFWTRFRKMTNVEFLICAYAALPMVARLGIYPYRGWFLQALTLLVLVICFYFFLKLLKRRLGTISAGNFISGSFVVVIIVAMLGSKILMTLALILGDYSDWDEYRITGLWMGGLVGFGFVIHLWLKWRRTVSEKPGSPLNA